MTNLRIAISQPPMHWTIEEHLTDVEKWMNAASDGGAELVLFPELTLTGLHTKVPELLDRARLEAALASVQDLCRRHTIAAAVGTPLWAGGSKPFATTVLIDSQGDKVLTSSKIRLMPPGEPLLFSSGAERPVVNLNDVPVAVVACREIFDHEEVASELAGRARVILWPASMARGAVDASNPEDATLAAKRLASDHQAWVFHSNWAYNVEVPTIPNTGKSMVVSPFGEVFIEAPARATGMLLGWEASLDAGWLPEDAL